MTAHISVHKNININVNTVHVINAMKHEFVLTQTCNVQSASNFTCLMRCIKDNHLLSTWLNEWINKLIHELMNERMGHLYSALLCTAVHSTRCTIIWRGGSLVNHHQNTSLNTYLSTFTSHLLATGYVLYGYALLVTC